MTPEEIASERKIIIRTLWDKGYTYEDVEDILFMPKYEQIKLLGYKEKNGPRRK